MERENNMVSAEKLTEQINELLTGVPLEVTDITVFNDFTTGSQTPTAHIESRYNDPPINFDLTFSHDYEPRSGLMSPSAFVESLRYFINDKKRVSDENLVKSLVSGHPSANEDWFMGAVDQNEVLTSIDRWFDKIENNFSTQEIDLADKTLRDYGLPSREQIGRNSFSYNGENIRAYMLDSGEKLRAYLNFLDRHSGPSQRQEYTRQLDDYLKQVTDNKIPESIQYEYGLMANLATGGENGVSRGTLSDWMDVIESWQRTENEKQRTTIGQAIAQNTNISDVMAEMLHSFEIPAIDFRLASNTASPEYVLQDIYEHSQDQTIKSLAHANLESRELKEISAEQKQDHGHIMFLYHGSSESNITAFDESKINKQPGFWLTDNPEYAKEHGKWLYEVNVRVKNPLILEENQDVVYKDFPNFIGESSFDEDKIYSKEFREFLEEKGYDAFQFKHSGDNTVIILHPEQVVDIQHNIKNEMNETIKFIEEISNSMGIDAFVDAQTNDNSFLNGVDMEAVSKNMEEGRGLAYIPVKVSGKEYDIDPVGGRLETKDGSISMGGGSDFHDVAQKIMSEVSDRIENSHSQDISIDAELVNKIKDAMLNTEYNYGHNEYAARDILVSLAEDGIDIRTAEVKDAWIAAYNKAEDVVWGSTDDQSYSTSISDTEASAFADAISIAEDRDLFEHTHNEQEAGHNAGGNTQQGTDRIIPDGTLEISDGQFSGRTDITSIEIPDSVRYIGDRAFKGCTGITEVNIPENVQYVGNEAFLHCSGLSKVEYNSAATTFGFYSVPDGVQIVDRNTSLSKTKTHEKAGLDVGFER